jgi:hypothetical protein
MAELMFCLSIIPHVRSFDVPPKLSPAQRGAFFAPLELKGGHAIGIVFGLSLLEALDDAGKLLVVKGQIGPAALAHDPGPLPVLRRRHQEI